MRSHSYPAKINATSNLYMSTKRRNLSSTSPSRATKIQPGLQKAKSIVQAEHTKSTRLSNTQPIFPISTRSNKSRSLTQIRRPQTWFCMKRLNRAKRKNFHSYLQKIKQAKTVIRLWHARKNKKNQLYKSKLTMIALNFKSWTQLLTITIVAVRWSLASLSTSMEDAIAALTLARTNTVTFG